MVVAGLILCGTVIALSAVAVTIKYWDNPEPERRTPGPTITMRR